MAGPTSRASALRRDYQVDVAVLGDAGAFADTVVEWLDEAGVEASGFATSVLAGATAIGSTSPSAPHSSRATLRDAMKALNEALPDERSIVVDGGRFTSTAVQVVDVPRPQSWSFSGRGFGAVGNGVATAIGLGLA